MSYINKNELVNALERIDIPSPEAIAIAEDAFSHEDKLGIAMLWGIRKFGANASVSVTEFRSCSKINNLDYFKTAARLAKN